MIKKKDQKSGPVEVDLTGPQGNAFALLGMARGWCKQLGKDFNKVEADMTSGDYEHLVGVLEREFGDYVIFYR